MTAPSEPGYYDFSVSNQSNSYGEVFSDSTDGSVSVELPDLIIYNISALDYYGWPYLRVGYPVQIKVTTKNQGSTSADGSNTGLYIDGSTFGTPSWSWNIGTLDAGYMADSYVNVTFNTIGWHYLDARADRLSQVNESDDNNNTYGSYGIYVY